MKTKTTCQKCGEKSADPNLSVGDKSVCLDCYTNGVAGLNINYAWQRCPNCGGKFIGDSMFCSVPCYEEYKKKIIKCPICKKEIAFGEVCVDCRFGTCSRCGQKNTDLTWGAIYCGWLCMKCFAYVVKHPFETKSSSQGIDLEKESMKLSSVCPKCYKEVDRLTYCVETNQKICVDCNNEIYAKKWAKNVDHPEHYNDHPFCECIDVVEHMNFNLGNAIKYVWRAGQKGNKIEDLNKAKWYIEREMERIKKYETE